MTTSSTAQSSLLSLNTSSDEIYALTSYINADAEARAWLDGTPDPWGMQVNPNYKGISLPVSSWPLLDSFILPDPGRANICLDFNGGTPYLPLISAPVSRLAFIGQDVEFGLSQEETGCSFTTDPNNPSTVTTVKFTAAGRQAAGQRFMLGLVDLGDAARDGLNLASLESVATAASPTEKITDASGRTFVAPMWRPWSRRRSSWPRMRRTTSGQWTTSACEAPTAQVPSRCGRVPRRDAGVRSDSDLWPVKHRSGRLGELP